MTDRSSADPQDLARQYPNSRRQVDPSTWRRAVDAYTRYGEPFHRVLAETAGAPGHLGELARLEHRLLHLPALPPTPRPATVEPNPTVQLVTARWRGLAEVWADAPGAVPEPGDEQLLLWRTAGGEARLRAATEADLLALKLVVEERDLRGVARRQGVAVAWLQRVLEQATRDGLLLAPGSVLRRDPSRYPPHPETAPAFREAAAFTLQWHVTHACDLHCRHCYDRSRRADLGLDPGLRLLDDLYEFCQARGVNGQVTFTGGNPLLLPHFTALYQAAAERGFVLTILGNPAPRESIAKLVAIQQPNLYQVSLEGLREHNDFIRGAGHFDRVLAFLAVLRDLGVHSMVMLTLTRDNRAQVLPLGEVLRERADTFHWNRLSPVGEGAQLAVLPPGEFREFLAEYRAAAVDNPVLGFKDNLFNPLLAETGDGVIGGCTGHGCGAAFNFLSVLPDGEAHACRKFPSPVGNVLADGIAAVYDSPAAARYRCGSDACRACHLAAVCGGCLASTAGFGLDPFAERDPYCWVEGR